MAFPLQRLYKRKTTRQKHPAWLIGKPELRDFLWRVHQRSPRARHPRSRKQECRHPKLPRKTLYFKRNGSPSGMKSFALLDLTPKFDVFFTKDVTVMTNMTTEETHYKHISLR
jgi:hypothetical protein